MKTDRELLELAAKAAGYQLHVWGTKGAENVARIDLPNNPRWNPRDDDGDALRLAVKLNLAIRPLNKCVFVESDPETLLGLSQYSALEMYGKDIDPCAATRRAIVCVAADIGEAME
jgi:hypothetical protein